MKTAVFWDIENIPPTKKNHVLENVETWLTKMGDVVYKSVAVNCYTIKKDQLVKVYDSGYKIECIPKYEKDATDKIIIREIRERVILDEDIQLYVLITQDSDFKNVIKELMKNGKFVVLLHINNRMNKEFLELPHAAYNLKSKCRIKSIEKVLLKKAKKNKKIIDIGKYKRGEMNVV